ncbi:hypothetical protein GobsT_14870 [Gemmata obscuriglobus]|uniref:PSP1 C-terminal domain-containing protein n=1 Tax=Gemmata obscuriglobus TaxID=114 RepID=A0A2Z3HEE4_9BACT|nr:hypothetical protein [Gemmata obscuriglobus]AWM40094.1 hypothetical protein C1280_25870 [Gemmata obscuriglobus]QEG26740.1 hypothetical protein GobsT_14870 [Gemmata obscuriglobus]VTS02510.1 PSP1 domain protein OS=Desulfotomaculum reducens (strain MI-1) GN=Dred_0061 PE=4 SV=1 [Gemmata obscuriglobus UQM 2246]
MTSTLVQFGKSGFVGRFTADEPAARGTRVVVHSPRGVECGLVLCAPGEPFSPALPVEGQLLRTATPDDDARTAGFAAREGELLGAANEAAASRALPVTFVDAELTLDDHLILHGLAWGTCDATPLFEDLSARFGLAVRLLDLSRAPVANDPKETAGGCGKPGCGSGGGGCSSCGTGGEKSGCSTGSCSRGKVKSADELSAYFADLRKQMESATHTRTPLV